MHHLRTRSTFLDWLLMIVAPDGQLPVQSNRVAEPHGWWENVCRNLFLFRRAFALTCDDQSDSTNDFAQAARKRRADFQELKLIPHSGVKGRRSRKPCEDVYSNIYRSILTEAPDSLSIRLITFRDRPTLSFTRPRIVRSIEAFNVLRGGEYFFMPSLSALKWLADREN